MSPEKFVSAWPLNDTIMQDKKWRASGEEVLKCFGFFRSLSSPDTDGTVSHVHVQGKYSIAVLSVRRVVDQYEQTCTTV